MQGNPETLTTFFSSVINFFWLLVFQHEERETHNFYYADCFIWPNKRAAHPVALSWTALAQVQISTDLAQSRISTDSTNKRPAAHNWTGLPQVRISTKCFFKNPQNPQPIASGHDVIHTPVLFPTWGFYYDICDSHILRARVWTPTLIAEQFKA